MPHQEHPDRAISSTNPDNDLAWMNAVLSPSATHAPSRPRPPCRMDDGSALKLDPDLPASSFRLQFLRAWIAARGSRTSEATSHA